MEPCEKRVANNLNRFRPMLLTLAEAFIAPRFRADLDASDLVQETLMEAHCHAHKLVDADDGQFFAWLRKSLRHNVLDAVKHLKTQKHDIGRRLRVADLEASFLRLEQILIADQTSPSQIVQRNEQISIMLAAVQQLPENQKTAVIMKHLRGFSLKEIAETLGLSESATAGLLHRGRQRLVRYMEERNHEL